MENPKLSEIIFALDQIKELHKDKEVSQLILNKTEVSVEFRDYKSYTIEIKYKMRWNLLKAKCKHCGMKFELHKPFGNHLAYEHDIYVSKIYKFKAKARKFIKKYF